LLVGNIWVYSRNEVTYGEELSDATQLIWITRDGEVSFKRLPVTLLEKLVDPVYVHDLICLLGLANQSDAQEHGMKFQVSLKKFAVVLLSGSFLVLALTGLILLILVG